jgi:hypothetical protein
VITRVFKAILLDGATYREVAEDDSATLDAFFLVIIYVFTLIIPYAFNGIFNWIMIVILIPVILLEWFVVTGMTYAIAGRLFHGDGTLTGLFRAMAYSVSAGMLNVLTIIPMVGILINGLIGILMFIASIIAIRSAMKIGAFSAVISLLLANFIAGLLISCIMVPIIFLMGLETLLNYMEQL